MAPPAAANTQMSFAAQRKIRKPAAELSELERAVATTLLNLESEHGLGESLKLLYVNRVTLVEVPGEKKAAVIYVTYPLLKAFQKNFEALIGKLEEQISGYQFHIVADRKVLAPRSSLKTPRPRSRTLAAVQEAMLADICYPLPVVGKRQQYKVGAPRKTQVFLPSSKIAVAADRIALYSRVYESLTGHPTEFRFM